MGKFKDWTGEQSYDLKVLFHFKYDKNKRVHYWICKCKCYNFTLVSSSELGHGTQSCGCVRREKFCKTITKHGLSKLPEYGIWKAIKARCLNKKNIRYCIYGERGIKICDEWLNSFENFYKHVGPRPSDKHSVDRYPDKNGDYKPGNVRWATDIEQASNKRNNVYFTFNGIKNTMSEWSRIYNVNQRFISKLYCENKTQEEIFQILESLK